VGTQFEVRVSDERVRLRVREGLVTLGDDRKTHTAREGEELRLAGGADLQRGTISVSGPDWMWVQTIAPPFDLEGRSVKEFLAWYGRETRLSVDLSAVPGAGADHGPLHGSLVGPAGALTPEEALGVLKTCRLTWRFSGTTLIIEPAPQTSSEHRTGRRGGL